MNQTITRTAAWLAPWFAALVVAFAIVLGTSALIVLGVQVSEVQAETSVQCIGHDDPMLTYAVATHRVPERPDSTCFGD
jgi:hypothetical protein